MAPNAFDFAVLMSSIPVIKNGCVCSNTPTNSCEEKRRTEAEIDAIVKNTEAKK